MSPKLTLSLTTKQSNWSVTSRSSRELKLFQKMIPLQGRA